MSSDWSWRVPSIVQAGFPIVQIVFWWFVPESPRYDASSALNLPLNLLINGDMLMLYRWLIANGRSDEAEKTLARYHTGGDTSHPLIRFEMAEIAHAIEMEKQASKTRYSALIETPGNRKRTFIAVCVGSFAQWNVRSLNKREYSRKLLNDWNRVSLSCHTISPSFSTPSASRIPTLRP